MNPSSQPGESLSAGELLNAFRFYQEAAERTKGQAWNQTTWLLTLNAAILAFSINVYLDHQTAKGFLLLEAFAGVAGMVLCGYTLFVLDELGKHIQNDWTNATRVAVDVPGLLPYMGLASSVGLRDPAYLASFPRFIERLRIPVVFFAVGHLAWFVAVAALSCP